MNFQVLIFKFMANSYIWTLVCSSGSGAI